MNTQTLYDRLIALSVINSATGRIHTRLAANLMKRGLDSTLDEIYQYTAFGDRTAAITMRERIYCIQHGIAEQPRCGSVQGCDRVVKFKSTGGYSNFCSTRCSSLDVGVKQKAKATNNLRYGADHAMCLPSTQIKAKQTCLDTYGVDNPNKSATVRQQIKDTCVDRYGVDNAFKSPSIQSKIKDTLLSRYGVSNPTQSPDIQTTIKNTNLDRYGVERPLQNLKIVIIMECCVYGIVGKSDTD